jgi:hypothetical protein
MEFVVGEVVINVKGQNEERRYSHCEAQGHSYKSAFSSLYVPEE